MNRIAKAYYLVTTLGPRWVWFRIRYMARRRSGGLMRRSKARKWPAGETGQLSHSVRWFLPSVEIDECAQTEANEILQGSFRLFSCHRVQAGFPPDWMRNPLTGQSAPNDRHWSKLGDFAFGDIKGIWELSRFPWAFALGRAYARSGDERYAERFWLLFENWFEKNHPNLGPNWMCGQEATFRLMAALWTCDVIRDAAASTQERLWRMEVFVIETARRIAANLDYALSQSNNHGVSECVGLVTAALRLPGRPESRGWKDRGWEGLQGQVEELVYADGGFSQHSAVYHRVLLHDLLWLICILERSRVTVPPWLRAAGERALGFIDALITPSTGRVPLYGPNDGANVLPLSNCDFLDFRPAVQAGHALLHGARRFPPGPWDEAAGWLATAGVPAELFVTRGSLPGASRCTDERRGRRGAEGGRPMKEGGHETNGCGSDAATNNESLITDNEAMSGAVHFPDAGVLVWRRGETRLFFRCPTRFHHRPAQADLLHVDIEWRGMPIAHDAGTFSYNTPGPFAGGLKEAAVHNTVTFDGAEPLQKVGRFLYLPWPKGRATWEGDEFVAAHDGWKRAGVQHERRLARRDSDAVVVIDRVLGKRQHRARVHWLLVDLPHELRPEAGKLTLRTAQGGYRVKWKAPAEAAMTVSLVRADPHSSRGWWSPYYGHAAPALSLVIEFDFNGEAEVVTQFEPVRTNDEHDTTYHE